MDTDQSLRFGSLLKRYRLAAALTQEALAAQAQLSVRGLSDLERGVRRAPRLETINLLAGALCLSARERNLFLAAARPAEPPSPRSYEPAIGSAPAAPALDSVPGAAGPLWSSGALAPFTGRAHELALLQQHLSGDGPPVLLLAGEPGIGKTRLLQEGARHAVARGWTVLTGGCQRDGGQQPYAPLLDALDHYIRGQTSLQLRRDLQGCAWLVRLLPELAAEPITSVPAGILPPSRSVA